MAKKDEASEESALVKLARDTGRIVQELQDNDHEPVKMTEAELWELYLLPPFED